MKSLKWEYMLTLLFAGCSMIILILIVLQSSYSKRYWAQVLREIENVKSSGFILQEVPDAKFKIRPLADYNEMLERPLFFSKRRPIKPEIIKSPVIVQPEIKPPEEISMVLIGIIKAPDGAYALFNNLNAKQNESPFKRLKQGEEINGWQVKEIKHDRVIVFAHKNSDEILLVKPRIYNKSKPKRKRTTHPFKQKK